MRLINNRDFCAGTDLTPLSPLIRASNPSTISPTRTAWRRKVERTYCETCKRHVIHLRSVPGLNEHDENVARCLSCQQPVESVGSTTVKALRKVKEEEDTSAGHTRDGIESFFKVEAPSKNLLVGFLNSRQWDQALIRLEEAPQEAVAAPGQRSALFWACKDLSCPKWLIEPLASAARLRDLDSSSLQQEVTPQLQTVVDLVTRQGRLDILKVLLRHSTGPNMAETLAVALELAYENVFVKVRNALKLASLTSTTASTNDLLNRVDRFTNSENDKQHDFETKWEILSLLYMASCDRDLSDMKEEFIVHDIVGVDNSGLFECPQPVLALACHLYRNQLSKYDPQGRIPLHVFLENTQYTPRGSMSACNRKAPASLRLGKLHRKRGMRSQTQRATDSCALLQVLLEAFPDAATYKTRDQDLPLHIAIRNGHSAQTIGLLIKAHPDAACVMSNSGLYPFQMAAAANRDPEVIFCLLKSHSGLIRPDQQIPRSLVVRRLPNPEKQERRVETKNTMRQTVSVGLNIISCAFFSNPTFH